MKKRIPNSDIIKFLATTVSNATFVQSLKIRYRPYICPFDELIDYAASEKSVFDVGCGSGQFAALVAEFTDVKKIAGIEIDSHLVDNATKINSRFLPKKQMVFSVFDGTTIPDNISEYDLVYMIDVYHHIPRDIREDFMEQLFKKMKKGAKLMFKDIDGASPLVPFNKIHDVVFAQEFGHEISHKHAVEFLSGLGFNILESRKKRSFVYPHYFVLAQK